MANRWLYAGGDLGCVRHNGTGTLGTDTSASNRNSAYSDHAILTDGTAGEGFFCDFVDAGGASDTATIGETAWFATYWRNNNSTTANNVIAIVDSSNQPWLSLRATGASNTFGLYYNSGTGGSPVWTLIGSTFTITTNALHDIVIMCTLGSPHFAEVFVDEISRASGNFTQASFTNADAAHCQAPNTNSHYWSEMRGTVGINTIGGHVFYGKPTGAGASSAWTGTFADIDDSGVSDADFISSGSAAQRSTFAYSDHPALASGHALGDLFKWTRGKHDGAAPSNLKPVRRTSGGTDNVGSSFSGVGLGFSDFLTRYSGIDRTEYNASEFGVESAT